jgi:superfamily I DNA and RNA helicase
LIPSSIDAETIYTWKDKDGVMKFSNEQPPEDVADFKTIVTPDAEANDSAPEARRRSSFDQMVKQASEAAHISNEQRIRIAAEKAAKQQRIAKEQQEAQRQAERKRLESRIEAIEKRAVSRTYPNGMKQAQIEALRKEIEKLE